MWGKSQTHINITFTGSSITRLFVHSKLLGKVRFELRGMAKR